MEVHITSEGCEEVDPRLEGVLVDGEPERETARLGAPRGKVRKGEHLPGIDLLGGTIVGEMDVS